jgi:hypothetical protein
VQQEVLDVCHTPLELLKPPPAFPTAESRSAAGVLPGGVRTRGRVADISSG